VKIGLTFNVRSGSASGDGAVDPHWPDDAEEEFDSPETIEALAAAIRGLGHEVELLGDGEPMLRRLLRRASGEGGRRPDLVFNFAEGTGTSRSREARVPALLEMLGIPYTGSDPLTLAVTLDKQCAKRLVRSAGVATPDWLVVDGDVDQFQDRLEALPLPVIVKPAFEGSSKGIHSTNLVEEPDRLIETVADLVAAYRQPVLVEEFIDGDELTVGIVGNQPREPLGIMRVVPLERSGPFVYSLEVKRDWERLVRYECPAKLAAPDTRAVADAALAVWNALGCRDLARVDFRLRNHVPYFLEVNPLPGLNPKSSDLVLMARALGLSYPDLISRILKAAIERLNDQPLAAAGV
jgi:D-alanine-D-alanine ligase